MEVITREVLEILQTIDGRIIRDLENEIFQIIDTYLQPLIKEFLNLDKEFQEKDRDLKDVLHIFQYILEVKRDKKFHLTGL